jgi:curved DNA-binding protein CbpA
VGVVEYADTPPPVSATTEFSRAAVSRLASRINSSDPYEILGVQASAPAEDLRTAYLELLRSCDPASTPDPEFRRILGQMSIQLTAAFKEIERRRGVPRPPAQGRSGDRSARAVAPPPLPRLGTPPQGQPRRKPPSVSKAPTQPVVRPKPAPSVTESKVVPAVAAVDPSQANEAAAQAYDAGLFLEALAILHDAMPRLSGQAKRVARVRKARVLLAVSNGAKLAEDELKAAIAEDGANADAHVLLGGIYRDRGALALAMAEYRKGLELQPKNAAAREALDELQAIPSAEKSPKASVLKRIFGR